MILKDVLDQLEAIAPSRLAQAWDNVGLIVGDPAQAVSKALLCIDYTAGVADEARAAGVDFVIAYHPPVFKPLKQLVAGGASAVVFDAVRRGVAIYSPHTALDVAEGGTNDVLADVIGLVDRRPLDVIREEGKEFKLVTFAPTEAMEKVANAIFAAGAGRIGGYSSCSFRVTGTGTFFGEEGTSPAAGEAGKLERVEEIRLETVVPAKKLAPVVAALRDSHPYEEPAFDLVPLAAPPQTIGLGRVGRLEEPTVLNVLLDRIKAKLDLSHVLVAGPPERIVSTAAVCAGSCGDHLDRAIAEKCDLYLTGEMRHHDALRAAAAGLTVVCTLHSNSERVTLAALARRLAKECPAIQWTLSMADRDPFQIR